MLIICEGPDLCGKSTLADRLRSYISTTTHKEARVIHAGPPLADPISEYVTPLADYVPGGGESIILDRWHVGEMVWPGFFGRPTQMGPVEMREIEGFLKERGALLIRCEMSVTNLERALERAEYEPTSPGDAAHILWLFDDAYLRSMLPQVSYRRDEEGVLERDDLIIHFVGCAAREEHRAQKEKRWSSSMTPATSVVGLWST